MQADTEGQWVVCARLLLLFMLCQSGSMEPQVVLHECGNEEVAVVVPILQDEDKQPHLCISSPARFYHHPWLMERLVQH